jgi:hypothetical protein
MTSKIAVMITAANLNNKAATDEVGKRLTQVFAEDEVYHLEPSNGRDTAAAFDWIVISRIADALGIASALWTIYEKTIRPFKRGADDNQGLCIMIDPEHGIQWFLGKEFKDREVFIKDFVARVAEYEKTDEAGHVLNETVKEVRIGTIWVRKDKGKPSG